MNQFINYKKFKIQLWNLFVFINLTLFHIDAFSNYSLIDDIQTSRMVAESLNHLQSDYIKLQKIIMDLKSSNDRLGGRDLILKLKSSKNSYQFSTFLNQIIIKTNAGNFLFSIEKSISDQNVLIINGRHYVKFDPNDILNTLLSVKKFSKIQFIISESKAVDIENIESVAKWIVIAFLAKQSLLNQIEGIQLSERKVRDNYFITGNKVKAYCYSDGSVKSQLNLSSKFYLSEKKESLIISDNILGAEHSKIYYEIILNDSKQNNLNFINQCFTQIFGADSDTVTGDDGIIHQQVLEKTQALLELMNNGPSNSTSYKTEECSDINYQINYCIDSKCSAVGSKFKFAEMISQKYSFLLRKKDDDIKKERDFKRREDFLNKEILGIKKNLKNTEDQEVISKETNNLTKKQKDLEALKKENDRFNARLKTRTFEERFPDLAFLLEFNEHLANHKALKICCSNKPCRENLRLNYPELVEPIKETPEQPTRH